MNGMNTFYIEAAAVGAAMAETVGGSMLSSS